MDNTITKMPFEERIEAYLTLEFNKNRKDATQNELYQAISRAALAEIGENWKQEPESKQVCYFSAEFLIGRMIASNLFNMDLLRRTEEYLGSKEALHNLIEGIDDAALGNGGLGRLAACFLDSAATHGVAMNGYGIRYRYGLFRQSFQNGWQHEETDNWLRFGDPWSIRREEEKEIVHFGDQSVYAVPYDMPVIGYGCGNEKAVVNTLRLWQAEPMHAFDFDKFNAQKYDDAVLEKNRAEDISSVLYPNDDTTEGKRLRLKQQYFFVCASLKSIIKQYKKKHGNDFSKFAQSFAIQMNDTHPTVAIPELLRLLMEDEGLLFDEAFSIVFHSLAYTNHTIMAEALEKWDVSLFSSVLPEVYPYVIMVNLKLKHELQNKGIHGEELCKYMILDNGLVHMARMAVFASHSTNGVARIHTEILKKNALAAWYALYPERFVNETNGITQRRWLALCNPELSELITEKIGNGWITDLSCLKELTRYLDDEETLKQFIAVKQKKKRQLAEFILKREEIEVNPTFLFDIQVKRLHEYKRQLLNAFSILDIYYGLLDGRIQSFTPTTFFFGAKAAPGYQRAKAIIKFINEIASLIRSDKRVSDKLQVVFVQNYDVSYAEKLIPAADISEQISTAGTEASGTGNMKFMLNGAVTLGTYDGANIEIVEQAGEDNNYIFGARVEEIRALEKNYSPMELYRGNQRIRRVVDTLVDGTFSDGGNGCFEELYHALLYGANWHAPDHYFLLHDFIPYCDAKLAANQDYANTMDFARKCFANTANAGEFSSDRTIAGYAKDIWNVKI